MAHCHKKSKKLYNCLGHFLCSYRLGKCSTPELSAYWNFVYAKRKQRGYTSYKRYNGIEKHHIVPKSFGGKNTPSNYVNLTTAEHMWAHVLFKNAICSSMKFTKHMRNKTNGSAPSMKIILKEWLQPSVPVMLLEYFS